MEDKLFHLTYFNNGCILGDEFIEAESEEKAFDKVFYKDSRKTTIRVNNNVDYRVIMKDKITHVDIYEAGAK